MVNRSRPSVPAEVDTVVIGNGPSAMTLSYLLHGHVPYYNYDGTTTHFDHLLDAKLSRTRGRPLYDALKDVDELCAHFEASGTYSSDAWPVNTLLDTLLWPNAEMDPDCVSTITFVHDPRYIKDHIVLGSAETSGGQWANTDHLAKGDNAKTLSYAEQLSLPGYSLAQFYEDEYNTTLPQYERPRRPQVSAYYAAYSRKTGIDGTMYNNTKVTSVIRNGNYTVLGESNGKKFKVSCKNIVLACGLFTSLIDPPVQLSPYLSNSLIHHKAPILIIGSGFSAADAIIENLGKRPIIHIYKWDSAKYTSPLKHCHWSSYPEYADIYRRMKLSAQSLACYKDYIGYADATIAHVREIHGQFEVVISSDGVEDTITAGEIVVLAGRRTSLDFLGPKLLEELMIDSETGWLEKSGLRHQITPVGPALTIDEGRILCIGSITGDSLVKFSYGAILGASMTLYRR